MRHLMWAMLALLLSSAHASAGPVYPWCAHYMMQNGPHNCGFTSFEQCLESVRGVGGFCDRNPHYAAPIAPRARHRTSG